MSDLPDDLLALAGGDSEDEGSVRSRGGSESPRRSKNDSGNSKKAKRRARPDDSEEEGEA
jgi:RNA polymerase-associated protein RTF1